MASIIIRLDSQHLKNPDLDIRYALPDMLVARSDGVIVDDGYDYVGESSLLDLFLQTADEKSAIESIVRMLNQERVLDNDLRDAATIAVKREGGYEIIYPVSLKGTFLSR